MPSIEDLVLVFSLAEHRFALEVKELVEVTEGLKVSSSCPLFDGFAGAVEFRQAEIPLIDMGQSLEISGFEKRSGVVLIVRIAGRTVALRVDAVIGVSGTKKSLLPFPDRMMTKQGLYPAVYDRDGTFVFLIRLENLFDSRFFAAMDAAERGEG